MQDLFTFAIKNQEIWGGLSTSTGCSITKNMVGMKDLKRL